MDTLLLGIPGTAVYLDDVIIVGHSTHPLEERIGSVLQRMQEYRFKLRREKCQFFLTSIKYLGFIFYADGRHPDAENIRSINQLPRPTNVGTLQSSLGLNNYCNAFLPSLHNMRAPLNPLLGQNVPWCWSAECERAFIKLKSLLMSDLLLIHYDPQKPIIVPADASSHGVGAVISHRFTDGSEKAIMHASRTLTAAEWIYCQIEKEAIALFFAVKKFHRMVYGRHSTLLTDHKPLITIFGSKKGSRFTLLIVYSVGQQFFLDMI